MQHLRYYLLLILLGLFLYLPGIAQLPLFDRDEPHFAQAARQMVETGDYWQVRFQDLPRHLKPPGVYWLQAAAVKWLSTPSSTQSWPYRLPSVLGAMLAVLFTFMLGCRFTNTKTAFLAAVLLAGCVLLIVEAHLTVTDAILLAPITAMQLALSQIYCQQRQQQHISWHWPACFWLAMAIGVFIKGMTPVIGGLTVLGLCIADKQLHWLKHLRSQWGIPLLLLLCAAWIIPFSIAGEHNFLWDMISGDLLPKIMGNQQSHGMPLGFFSLIFTASFWPGSLFIVPTAVWSWRNRHQSSIRFLLAWILPVWIFFECIHTKLPEYVLPVYPAIALLTALFITNGQPLQVASWLRWIRYIQQGLWLICGLGLMGAAIILGGWGWLTALLIGVGIFLLLFYFYHPSKQNLLLWGMIITAGAAIPVWQITLPSLPALHTSEQVAKVLEQTAPNTISDQQPLLAIDYQEPSLVFYLGTYRVKMVSLDQAVNIAAQQPQTVLLIAQNHISDLNQLLETPHPPLRGDLSHKERGNLSMQLLGEISGLQYNRGHRVNLTLLLLRSGKSR